VIVPAVLIEPVDFESRLHRSPFLQTFLVNSVKKREVLTGVFDERAIGLRETHVR
jgi:hypothetical protein